MEYYPFVLIVNAKKYYCIWYSGSDDGFVVESANVKCFDSKEQLFNYASTRNVTLKEEQTSFSVDLASV